MSNDSGAPVAPVGAPAAPVATNTNGSAPLVPAVPAAPKPANTPSAPAAPTAPAAPVAPPASGTPAAPAAPASSDALVIGDAPTTPVVPPVVGEKQGKVVSYDPTGNPKLDITLGFLGKLGIEPTHPGMVAAATGDFSILKAHLATLGTAAQGWEANVALGESAIQEQNTATATRRAADQKAIFEAVGGEARWAQIKDFVGKATADSPTERTEINAALAQGGMVARAMSVYLDGVFQKASTSQEPAPVTNGVPAATAAPASAWALSPRQYTAKVAELNAKFRSSGMGAIDGSKEYQELQSRRAAWREPRN